MRYFKGRDSVSKYKKMAYRNSAKKNPFRCAIRSGLRPFLVVGQNTKYKTGDFAGFVICILSYHVCCGETKNKTTLINDIAFSIVEMLSKCRLYEF
jgi:hypothetical protein